MGSCCQWEEGADQDKRIIVFKTLSIQIICQPHQTTTPTSHFSSACVSWMFVRPCFLPQFVGNLTRGRQCWCPQDVSPHKTQKSATTMLNHLRERSRSLFPSYKPGSRTPAVKEYVDLTNTCVKPWSSMQVGIISFIHISCAIFLFHCLLLAKLSFTISKWVRHLVIFSKWI